MPDKYEPPHNHKQIFDDHPQEDAALKKWEDDDRWIGWFIKNLGSALRRLGYSKEAASGGGFFHFSIRTDTRAARTRGAREFGRCIGPPSSTTTH